MTIYRLNGRIVDRETWLGDSVSRETLESPRVSRFEPMESPVTGKTITSWRERDRDMQAADAFDYRDVKGHKFSRGRKAQAAAAKAAREQKAEENGRK